MWIEKLTVSNYKALHELELNLKPGVNLLIGDNGVGKTI
ncbi:MAG: AAA family ATPase [Hungatella sp.]|nr:AAA family ATPase [Hungatella sp.]